MTWNGLILIAFFEKTSSKMPKFIFWNFHKLIFHASVDITTYIWLISLTLKNLKKYLWFWGEDLMLVCWVETIDCYKRILRKSFDLLKQKHDKNIGNKIKAHFRHFFLKKKNTSQTLFPGSFLHIFGHIFFIHLVVRDWCKAVLQLPGSDYDDNAAIWTT